MGTVSFDFLQDSFLFVENHIASAYQQFSDSELQAEISRYHEFCDSHIDDLLCEIPDDSDLWVFSGPASISIDTLSKTALYVQGYILNDPLLEYPVEPHKMTETMKKSLGMKGWSINREDLTKRILYIKRLTPMVAANYVKFLPMSRFLHPREDVGIYYSDNYFSDLLPTPLMQFFRHRARVQKLERDETSWIMRDGVGLSPCRAIFVGFEGHPDVTGAIYFLYDIKVLSSDKEERLVTVSLDLSEVPPEKAYFDAWVFQSVNRAAGDFYDATMRKLAMSSELKSCLLIHSPFEFELLEKLGLARENIKTYTSRALLNLDLPLLEGVDATTLMKIRTSEAEAFQNFRDTLERSFRELRLENDPERLRIKTENLIHELTEVQIRQINSNIASLQKSALVETVIALGGLVGAVHTGGWSLLAAGTAVFQGFKTFEEYRRDVKLNPAYFLWKTSKAQTPARKLQPPWLGI
jgi:hypothetical protein